MNILSRIMYSSSFRSLSTLGLVLFVLVSTFTIQKDSKSYLTQKESVHSTFYVAGSSPLNNQKDIPLWASFYSPTIFIRSNTPLNYSYKLQVKNQPLQPVMDDSSGEYKMVTRTLAEQDFMKRHFSLMQVLYDNYRPYPIGSKLLQEKKSIKQNRIYFTTSMGLIIPALPSFQKLDVVPKVKRTILKVSNLDTKMPLVSLIQSSSSQGLDQKALTAINQSLLKIQTRTAVYKIMQSPQGILEIEWRVK